MRKDHESPNGESSMQIDPVEESLDSVSLSSEAVALDRRHALARLAKHAAYVGPATLALLTMEAKACSLTC